jgi:hypothetical protein
VDAVSPFDKAFDREVHAGFPDGGAIVRYERAGKWYLEYPPDAGIKRKLITLKEAVALTIEHEGKPGSFVGLGRAGGLAFDSAYHRAKGSRK